MKKTLYRYRYEILLLVLWTFYAINNYHWIGLDSNAITFDNVHHARVTILIRNLLEYLNTPGADFHLKINKVVALLKDTPFGWSPFIHSLTAWSYLILPLHPDIFFHMRFFNIVYLFIFLSSIYLIGKEIHSPLAGFLATILLGLYPAVFGFSHFFGLDLPLATIVSLLFYLLLLTRNFSRPGASLLFGVIFGLSLLIKLKGAIFLLGPLIYIFFAQLMKKENKRKFLLHATLAIAITCCLALIWWHKIFSWPEFIELQNHIFTQDINSDYHQRSALGEWTFYSAEIFLNISLIFFVFFLFGLIFFLRKIFEKNRYVYKNYLFILLWLVIPYIIFSLFRTKSFRYMLPAFGAISLISAIGWLESPIQKNIKKATVVVLIIFGMLQFFKVSYGYPRLGFHYPNKRSQWLQKPTYNNHAEVADQFELTMRFSRMTEKKADKTNLIGIVEEFYFRGDKCVRLGNYFLSADSKNYTILTSDGAWPYYLREEFLTSYDGLDFLIAFSPAYSWPDFASLKTMTPLIENHLLKFDREIIITHFRQYHIVDYAMLLPENISVFLLKKYAPSSQQASLLRYK